MISGQIKLAQLVDAKFTAGLPPAQRTALAAELKDRIITCCDILNQTFLKEGGDIQFASFGRSKRDAENIFRRVDPRRGQLLSAEELDAREGGLSILDRKIPITDCAEDLAQELTSDINSALHNLGSDHILFFTPYMQQPHTGVFVFGNGWNKDHTYWFNDESACSISGLHPHFSCSNSQGQLEIIMRNRMTALTFLDTLLPGMRSADFLRIIGEQFIAASGADPKNLPADFAAMISSPIISNHLDQVYCHERAHAPLEMAKIEAVGNEAYAKLEMPPSHQALDHFLEELYCDLSDEGSVKLLAGLAESEPDRARAIFFNLLWTRLDYLYGNQDIRRSNYTSFLSSMYMSCIKEGNSIDYNRLENLRISFFGIVKAEYMNFLKAISGNNTEEAGNAYYAVVKGFREATGIPLEINIGANRERTLETAKSIAPKLLGEKEKENNREKSEAFEKRVSDNIKPGSSSYAMNFIYMRYNLEDLSEEQVEASLLNIGFEKVPGGKWKRTRENA